MGSRGSGKEWVTKDGRHVKIRDMTDQHLGNAIARIQRSEKTGRTWRKEWLVPLQQEKVRRLEAAARTKIKEVEAALAKDPMADFDRLFEVRE